MKWDRADDNTLMCEPYMILRTEWGGCKTYTAYKREARAWIVVNDTAYDSGDEARAACERDAAATEWDDGQS